jgi:monoterpene epsilon-lactone hydrolase
MENIQQRREGFEQLGKLYPKEASVKVKQDFFSGVNCYWFTPQDAKENKIIIYLHGGVYAMGSILSHESLVSHVAQKLRTTLLFVDYALAPERPFPAANEDVLSVYTTLINEYADCKIGIIGDSAGGGLIVSTVSNLLKRQLPLPEAVVMISPWISLQGNNPSQKNNRSKDPVLTKDYLKGAAKDYIGNATIETVSPEYLTFSTFPPALIVVGSNEILLDDSVNFYGLIKNLNPKSRLTIYDNQNHVWPLANIHSEASQQLLIELDEFINN